MLSIEDKQEISLMIKNEIEKYHINSIEKMERNIIAEIDKTNKKMDRIEIELKENRKDTIENKTNITLILKLIYFLLGVMGSMFVGVIALIVKEFFTK